MNVKMCKKAISFVVVALVSSLPAFAVIDNGVLPGGNAGEGISTGSFVIYPTLEVIYQFESNLFLTPTNEVSDSSYAFRPKIMVELPYSRSYFRAGYSGEFRDYDKYEMRDNWTHTVIVDGGMHLASGLDVTIRQRFVKSMVYTEEFDENHEIFFGNDPYRIYTSSATVSYHVTPKIVGVIEGEFKNVKFEDDNDSGTPRTFFDYRTITGRVELNYLFRANSSIGLLAGRTETEQDREFEGVGDNRKVEGSFTGIVVKGLLTPTLSGTIEATYQSTKFEEIEGFPDSRGGDYKGHIYRMNLGNRFSEKTMAVLTVGRAVSQSSFVGSNYYVSTFGMFTLTYNLSKRTFWSLGGAFHNNAYSSITTVLGQSCNGGCSLRLKRDDDVSSVKLGAGFYFNRRASARLNYQYEERDSNITFFNYKTNRYLAEVNIGW